MILLFKFNRVTILETWDNLIIICADLSCTHITQSVKVGCNFQLSVLVKLVAVLLLKLHQMQCTSTSALCVNSLEKLTRCEVGSARDARGCYGSPQQSQWGYRCQLELGVFWVSHTGLGVSCWLPGRARQLSVLEKIWPVHSAAIMLTIQNSTFQVSLNLTIANLSIFVFNFGQN